MRNASIARTATALWPRSSCWIAELSRRELDEPPGSDRRTQTAMLGAASSSGWRRSSHSRQATWKIMASDQPHRSDRRRRRAERPAAVRGVGQRRRPAARARARAGAAASRSSSSAASTTSSGSPPTCTTRRPTSSIRVAPSSPTSCRSGNSSPARCTPARSAPNPVDPTFGCKAVFNAIPPDLEAQSTAERGVSVLRHSRHRSAHAPAHRGAVESAQESHRDRAPPNSRRPKL